MDDSLKDKVTEIKELLEKHFGDDDEPVLVGNDYPNPIYGMDNLVNIIQRIHNANVEWTNGFVSLWGIWFANGEARDGSGYKFMIKLGAYSTPADRVPQIRVSSPNGGFTWTTPDFWDFDYKNGKETRASKKAKKLHNEECNRQINYLVGYFNQFIWPMAQRAAQDRQLAEQNERDHREAERQGRLTADVNDFLRRR
jgi:hypothetical protein